MNIKNIAAIALAGAMMFSLASCGNKKEEKSPEKAADTHAVSTGMANPVKESTPEEILGKIGIPLQAPAGSENVSYQIIESEPAIAQMQFTLDDSAWCYRVSMPPQNTDISGMYYEWKETSTVKVGYNDAKVSLIAGEQGVISWYDVVPGIMYSLSVEKGADAEKLGIMANSLYEPMQGDADGNFAADFTDLLHEIQQNLHPATAGCSLVAANYAAELMDLFSAFVPDSSNISETFSFFAQSLSGNDAGEFNKQIELLQNAAENLKGENMAELLQECGYGAEIPDWDMEAMSAAFSAMKLG